MKKCFLTVLVALCVWVPATANAGGDSSVTSASPGSTSHEKSGRTAFLYSFLATGILGGAAMIVKSSTGDQDHQSDVATTTALGITAYLAGPSIGHFYAGETRRAWIGVGLRGVIGLGFAAALVTLADEDPENDLSALGVGLVAAAGGAMVVDIVTAPRSARIHNEKVHRLSIGPASVGGAPGIRVAVSL
jgi:membrane associated rhomboid family serine protease